MLARIAWSMQGGASRDGARSGSANSVAGHRRYCPSQPNLLEKSESETRIFLALYRHSSYQTHMHQAPSTSTDRLTGLLQQFGEDMATGVTETRWLPAPLVAWILALIKEFVETFANLAAQLRNGEIVLQPAAPPQSAKAAKPATRKAPPSGTATARPARKPRVHAPRPEEAETPPSSREAKAEQPRPAPHSQAWTAASWPPWLTPHRKTSFSGPLLWHAHIVAIS